MDEIVRRAVARAIITMQENLGDRLTVDDLARSAMFSKFHFTRVFHRATGLSPGRFLSALRLAEAKRLLMTTAMSVADISHQVGYNSVGTFSARFSSSVGASPTAYRHLRGHVHRIPERTQTRSASGITLRGQLTGPPAALVGPVFVGLFPGRLMEGAPVRHAVLPGTGSYALHDVPPGTWFVLAHGWATMGTLDELIRRPCTGHSDPIAISSGVAASLADVHLHPRRGFDPPLLLALPDLNAVAAPYPVAV
jgi:AraC family transcriptional regulator